MLMFFLCSTRIQPDVIFNDSTDLSRSLKTTENGETKRWEGMAMGRVRVKEDVYYHVGLLFRTGNVVSMGYNGKDSGLCYR